ncbi:hypothetical protein TYRP_011803, partial [Tyrophagus putrescentiae]
LSLLLNKISFFLRALFLSFVPSGTVRPLRPVGWRTCLYEVATGACLRWERYTLCTLAITEGRSTLEEEEASAAATKEGKSPRPFRPECTAEERGQASKIELTEKSSSNAAAGHHATNTTAATNNDDDADNVLLLANQTSSKQQNKPTTSKNLLLLLSTK